MAINNLETEYSNDKTDSKSELELKTRICELLGSIHFHGNFIPETANERELDNILNKLGYKFKSEKDLLEKLYKHKNE